MYASHFKLTAEPFSLTPDPDCLYLSPGHAEALAALKVGLMGRRGLMVMSGEVGTGKTTLLYALLRALGEDMRTAYVSNTALGFDGLLHLALSDFAVTPASPARVDMLTALNQLLRDCAERGYTATLVVDEAQNLDAEAFEQLRLLSNFETFTDKLLQIVLVGQPELEQRLREPALRALTERVAVHCRLSALSERESRAYVDYRLCRAGGSARLFAPAARDLLLAEAEGLPRRINILCHNALLFAYGRGAARVKVPVARLAVDGRAALVRATPPEEPAAPAVVPTMGRVPQWAVALGGVALIALLGLAFLRAPERQRHIGAQQVAALAVAAPVAAAAAVPAPAVEASTGSDRTVAPPEDIVAGSSTAPDPVDRGPLDARPAAPPAVPGAAALSSDASAPVPPPGSVAAPPEQPVPPAAAAPSGFRTVRVQPGSTLESLARDVYGGADPALIKRIQSANPQVVDPNFIMAGDLLRFPEGMPGSAAARKSEAE
jgi:type II secretory pathway predicted ATPase ExeA